MILGRNLTSIHAIILDTAHQRLINKGPVLEIIADIDVSHLLYFLIP
jgi:uncharacterized protein (DUF2249 family)